MWTSVSGAAAQAQNVDTIANNLANANTDGFKKDQVSFKEYLASSERDNQNPTVPHGRITDRDLNSMDVKDRDQSHVIVEGTFTHFRQGNIKVTNGPLDLALEGPGLIEVAAPGGTRYTRAGALQVNQEGRLVTREGYPVLSAAPGGGSASGRSPAGMNPGDPVPGSMNDPAMAGRFISLRDRGPVSFTEQGEIYAGGDLVAKVSLVEFSDPKFLIKSGNQYFENKDAEKNVASNAARTQVHQGMLESSNVNPIEEMANLINANRMFEHDMKVMKTFGEMMGREANDIGKL